MVTKTEFYRFSEQGSVEVFAYTSGDDPVTYDGVTYIPASIDRSEIESSQEMKRANLDIKVPLTNPAAQRWLKDNGENIVSLTIFSRDKFGDITVAWKGRLVGTIPAMNSISLRFESIFTSQRRSGLRARYQGSCRHPLYARGCNLNAEDFAWPGQCTALNGVLVTVAEAADKPDGYFTGGMIRSPDGVLSYIIDHAGTTVKLQRPSFSLQTAMTTAIAADSPGPPAPFIDVILYPGCPHDIITCDTRYDNKLNYGGYDFIPKKNPMGGSSIV